MNQILGRDDPASMERCLPIVVDAVRRHSHRFAHLSDVSIEDLVNEYLVLIRQQAARFDPRKGNLSTWINRIVSCRVADLVKTDGRRRPRELAYTQAAAARAADSAPVMPAQDPTRAAELLVDELRDTYREIAANLQKYIPAKSRGAHPRYSPAQRLAICWLKRREGLSLRGLHKLLKGRQELREALELSRCPGRVTLARMEAAAVKRFKVT